MTNRWKSGVMVLVAIGTSARTAVFITPDVLLSAFLFLYLGFAGGKNFGSKLSTAFGAGVAGGLAYLAKSYAFPFFLVHLSVLIAFLLWWQRGAAHWMLLIKSWSVSLMGFLLIAGPWIWILSNHYHRPTFSTVAKIAHAIVGPTQFPLIHPLHQLSPPSPSHLSAWETPEILPYAYWSPVSDAKHLKHQLQVIRHNSQDLLSGMQSLDAVGLYPALFLVFGFLVLWKKDRERMFLWVFMLLTCGIYGGGFLLVYFDSRYLLSFLWPLLLWYLLENLSSLPSWGVAKGRVLTVAVALSALLFGAVPAFQLARELVRGIKYHGAQGPYRALAKAIAKQPVASLGAAPGLWYEGLYVSYHSQIPYHGIPSGEATSDWLKQLGNTGTQAVLIEKGSEKETDLRLLLSKEVILPLSDRYALLFLR